MKFITAQIQAILIASSCTNSILLPGKITHAMTKNKERTEREFRRFNKSKTIMLESVAVKDEKGEFVTEKGEGNQLEYTFPTPEIKDQVIAEINKLGETEVEIEFHNVPEEELEKITAITPEQMVYVRIFTGNLSQED